MVHLTSLNHRVISCGRFIWNLCWLNNTSFFNLMINVFIFRVILKIIAQKPYWVWLLDLKLARYFRNHIFIKLWCISLRCIGISKKNWLHVICLYSSSLKCVVKNVPYVTWFLAVVVLGWLSIGRYAIWCD